MFYIKHFILIVILLDIHLISANYEQNFDEEQQRCNPEDNQEDNQEKSLPGCRDEENMETTTEAYAEDYQDQCEKELSPEYFNGLIKVKGAMLLKEKECETTMPPMPPMPECKNINMEQKCRKKKKRKKCKKKPKCKPKPECPSNDGGMDNNFNMRIQNVQNEQNEENEQNEQNEQNEHRMPSRGLWKYMQNAFSKNSKDTIKSSTAKAKDTKPRYVRKFTNRKPQIPLKHKSNGKSKMRRRLYNQANQQVNKNIKYKRGPKKLKKFNKNIKGLAGKNVQTLQMGDQWPLYERMQFNF